MNVELPSLVRNVSRKMNTIGKAEWIRDRGGMGKHNEHGAYHAVKTASAEQSTIVMSIPLQTYLKFARLISIWRRGLIISSAIIAAVLPMRGIPMNSFQTRRIWQLMVIVLNDPILFI